MGKKIFVGNLSFSTTSAELESLFSQVGTCESAAVVTDRDTGRSRGFGFVEMSSASEAGRAITELNGRDVGPADQRQRGARAGAPERRGRTRRILGAPQLLSGRKMVARRVARNHLCAAI